MQGGSLLMLLLLLQGGEGTGIEETYRWCLVIDKRWNDALKCAFTDATEDSTGKEQPKPIGHA